MSVTALSPIKSHAEKKVFGPPEGVLAIGRTLVRLVKINLNTPKTEHPFLKTIRDILSAHWENLFAKRFNPDFESCIFGLLNAALYQNHDPDSIESIANVFQQEISAIETEEEGVKWKSRFEKDVKTLTTVDPLFKTECGDEGPTYLVEYPRMKKDLRSDLYSYVIKWTDWNEIRHNRIYQLFADFLKTNNPQMEFRVPLATAFDFQKLLHFTCEGREEPLNQHMSQKIYNCFHKIVELRKDHQSANAQQLVLFQKVAGQDLLEFARFKYGLMVPEQKELFFKQLAAISMLDLLLGHNDRLAHIDYENKEMMTLPEELDGYDDLLQANLGNVMVSWMSEDSNPVIYAIDNGIELPLTDGKYRDKHIAFIKQLLQSTDLENRLARNVKTAVLKAVKIYLQELKDDSLFEAMYVKSTENLENFLRDLENDSCACTWLRQGLMEVCPMIKQKLGSAEFLDKFKQLAGDAPTNFPQIFGDSKLTMEAML